MLRARALIDAGVPVAEVNQPNAIERSFGALDERIARLKRQRERLLALAQAPNGTPQDIRESLKVAIHDPAMLQLELDSWDLMALCGVATEGTWQQLRENLEDAECLRVLRDVESLWRELGALSPNDREVTVIVAKLQRLGERGLMRGIYPTLRPGKVLLSATDAPTTGAQGRALAALAGAPHG